MEVKNHVVYNIEKSAERIQEILDSNNANYKEKGNVVPSRATLTYNNGYYVNVTALFIVKDQHLLRYIGVLYLNV